MAKAFIDDTHLTDIADAIRATLDESRQYLPSEMAAAIQSVPIMAQLNRKKYFQAVPAGAASGYATIEQIDGNTVAWNQLVDTGDTSCTVPNGHVYYANINGTASIATSDGAPISVTGGTDIIHDLTAIFGSGNEPTTVADFEAWMAQNGLPSVAAYNAGELISCKMESLKSIGFNQWDEELESGSIDSNGQNTATPNTRRSKNYIPILPGIEYFWCIKNHTLAGIIKPRYYDGSKNYIGAADADGQTSGTNVIRRMPANARYFRFWLYTDDYGSTTYQNDICINISDPAKNGTYKPYQTDLADIDITTITGLNTATNVREVIFADCMNKASDNDVDIIDLTTNTAERVTFVLPNTYQELEWLKTDGDAYIQTSLLVNRLYTYKLKFNVTDFNYGGWVIGARVSSSGSRNDFGVATGAIRFGTQYVNKDFTTYNDVEVIVNGVGYTINGENTEWSGTPTVDNDSALKLFWAQNSAAQKLGKIYYLQILDSNGVSLLHLIPAKRIADSVLGMYDIVSNTFLSNAGTGDFVAGPVVVKNVYPLATPITYTDLQDANGNPLNPRYKVEVGGTEQVLPVNTSTPTTVAPTLSTIYKKNI